MKRCYANQGGNGSYRPYDRAATLTDDLPDGRLGYGPRVDAAQDDDMTIFGLFGGEVGRGPELLERQQRAARLFRGGSGRCEEPS